MPAYNRQTCTARSHQAYSIEMHRGETFANAKVVILLSTTRIHRTHRRHRALRTFFIWYQVLGACEAADEQMDMLFEAALPTTNVHPSTSRPESLTSTHASDNAPSEYSSSSDPRTQQQRINNLAHECHKFLNTMFCDTHLVC